MAGTTIDLMAQVADMPPERSWYQINAKAGGVVELMIYDDIGAWGMSAQQFAKDLSAVAKDATLIKLYLHSLGGDVLDGLAIYNMLKNHPAKVHVFIGGIAASMGSVIAMAGDVIYIPSNAWIMIHKPWGIQGGNADDMRNYADMLDNFEASLMLAYTSKTGLSSEEVGALLTAETWLMGADAVAKGFADELLDAVEMSASLNSNRFEDFEKMPDAVKNFMAARGQASGRPGATRETPQDGGNPAPQPAPLVPQGGVSDEQPNAAVMTAQVLAQEQSRRTNIRAAFAGFDGHQTLLDECLDDPKIDVAVAQNKLLAALGKSSQPAAGGHRIVHVGNGNISRDHMVQAVLGRVGKAKVEKDNHYRGYTLQELARASLSDRGVACSGMDRMEMIALAFTHTSSDFGNILQDVARKSMLLGFDEAPETFQEWTKKGNLSDFKVNKRVGLESFPSLDEIPDGGEYKYATLNDTGESIQLATYGKMFSITRQTIINDDLSAFTDIPNKMGRAALRTVGNLVYALLMSDHKMSDGIPLFHAKHKNLMTAAGMSVASLEAMELKMALQEDSAGSPLNIEPAFLLAPRALKSRAKILMESVNDPDLEPKHIVNTVHGLAKVVTDARIDKAIKEGQPLPYFLAGGNQFDTIEVAYLDGNELPYIEQQEGWKVDGAEFKVRLDAGVSPLSYRTLIKNPGVV